MLTFVHDMDVRKEGRAEGTQIVIINQIYKKVKNHKTIEEIAGELEEEVDKIKPFYDFIVANQSWTVDQICEHFIEI